jgi:hypothetical protein
VAGCCEHRNETLGSIVCWKILLASQEGLTSIELVSYLVKCFGKLT